jgi:hypothetical protein
VVVLALIGGGLGSLGMLALAAGALAYGIAVRRRDPGRTTIRLTGQHALHVVHVEGRRLVIGTGPGAAPHLLTTLENAPYIPTPGEERGCPPS